MDVGSLPYKLGEFSNGAWRGYRHANSVAREQDGGNPRLVIGTSSPLSLVLVLASKLSAPVRVLIALHSPRGNEPAGRYESPDLGLDELESFLHRYRGAFERDARCDLWILAPNDGLTLTLDKHDLIFVSGPFETIESDLLAEGYTCKSPQLPMPHSHHYGDEFDLDFQAMLGEFDWKRLPLEPGDGD